MKAFLTAKDKLRFEARFIRAPGCWLWHGAKDGRGYGALSLRGKATKAHRISYSEYIGPIPYDLKILHKCDIPNCVNPKHLFAGTSAQNTQDMCAKGRARGGNEKLNKAQVIAIRGDSRMGKIIAREYKIHPSSVSLIKNKKIWRHI